MRVELVHSNACSDLPRKVCVSHGMIDMLMSFAAVVIMILSTCGVRTRVACRLRSISYFSCGAEIKVAAKAGTCSASIFHSSFPLHVASRKPLFIFEVSAKPSAIFMLILHC